jgi:hypothetical protein
MEHFGTIASTKDEGSDMTKDGGKKDRTALLLTLVPSKEPSL